MINATPRRPYLKTVGELRRALEAFPDSMPLALDGRGVGWGLAPPYVARHRWVGDMHCGFYSEEALKQRRPNQCDPIELLQPMCVLEPSVGV